ncbi:MAG TPA: hypothetical protein VMZ28_17240 [Kofleriaceae bacterium]|nr:hypothetical protein [Kofleriaceae bacterium]
MLAPACGGDDDGGGGGGGGDGDADAAAGADGAADEADAAPSAFTANIIRPSCAPNDGAAVRILLGEPVDGTGCNVDDSVSMVDLEVWTADIEAPQTFDLAEADGAATVCPGGEEPCRTYDVGTIHFDTFEADTGATGTFDVGEGADSLSGTFSADWCDPTPPEPCG